MSGWMEVTELSEKFEVVRAVVPTLALPLAAVGLILNALATFIAGLFGYRLKWEGPKKLLEVLLKPRVILAAMILNLCFFGLYKGYVYLRGYPAPLWRIQWVNERNQELSAPEYKERRYTDWLGRVNRLEPAVSLPVSAFKINQLWKVKLRKGAFSAVSLSGHSAFVGSDDGYLYELDQADGKTLRRFYIGTEVTTEPIIWNSRVFVGEGIHTTHHARLYSFDLHSGQMLGAFQTEGHTEGTPSIATSDGVTSLFVMAGKDGIYSVDPESMKERWHQVLGHTDSEVRVDGGRVYFATGVEKGSPDRSHRAYSLDFKTGEVIWSAELAASGWMAPVMVGREVCFGVGEIYTDSKFGQLACFDKISGEVTHAINTKSPVMGVPFAVGSTVVFSDLMGEVCAYSWPSAARLWCHMTDGKTYASVSYEDHGNFLYPSAKHGLLLLDATSGNIKAQWQPTKIEGKWAKAYSRLTQGDDGWFLADSVGNVRKFSLEPVLHENQAHSK